MRSYFGSPRSLEGKTRKLSARIAALEIVTTRTEQDALHLEATLVKRHQPLYNVRLKDDKHYPYLKVDVISLSHERHGKSFFTRSNEVRTDLAEAYGPK